MFFKCDLKYLLYSWCFYSASLLHTDTPGISQGVVENTITSQHRAYYFIYYKMQQEKLNKLPPNTLGEFFFNVI